MAKRTKSYGLNNPLQDVFPVPIVAQRAPTTSDTNYEVGQQWVDQSGGTIYGLVSVSSGSATWALTGPGSSDVDTLTPDAGDTPVSASSGTIGIVGGTNITTTGSNSTSPHQISIAVDDAITLATSVTSPLYTVAAATDLSITGVAGQDVIVTLGGSAGAENFIVEAGDGTDLWTVDSSGTITFSSLTVTGAFAQTGGTFNVGQDNAANAINIGGGTTARAIAIGNSTGAHTIALGNSSAGAATWDSAAGISIDAATASNFTVTGASENLTLASAGGSVAISATEDAASAISLTANGGTSETIVLTASQGIGVDSITLDSTAGGLTLSAALASDDAINLTASAGGVDIDGALQVNIASSEDAADAIRLNASAGGIDIDATGEAGQDITVTNTGGSVGISASEDAADAVTIAATAGGIDITATGEAAQDIDISNTGGSVNISATEDTADAITIAATAGGIDITATGAAAEDLDLTCTNGSVNVTAGEADAAAITLQAASGGLDIDTGLAIIGDAAGNIELNSSAGQILIGNDDVDQNASFATDGERTVTVGSTNGAASLVLQSGTGKTTMTGTVQQIDCNFIGAAGVYVPSFNMDSLALVATNAGGVPSGTDTDVNNVMIQGGYVLQQYNIGTQSILQPIMTANGLAINGDQTNTEGLEFNIPYLQYTIGTSAAFFIELGLYINDMDGAAPYVVGFRKTEANNATFDSYTDYATIGMIAASSTTNIVTATELNSGGQTVTDTTDAWGGDGSTNTLAVLVDASGNVTYTIGGAAPSASAAFQFDNTDVVIPFIRIGHSASATDVAITSLRIGFQA